MNATYQLCTYGVADNVTLVKRQWGDKEVLEEAEKKHLGEKSRFGTRLLKTHCEQKRDVARLNSIAGVVGRRISLSLFFYLLCGDATLLLDVKKHKSKRKYVNWRSKGQAGGKN